MYTGNQAGHYKDLEDLQGKLLNIKDLSKYLRLDSNFKASLDMLDGALSELLNRDCPTTERQNDVLIMTIKQLNMMADDLVLVCKEKIKVYA